MYKLTLPPLLSVAIDTDGFTFTLKKKNAYSASLNFPNRDITKDLSYHAYWEQDRVTDLAEPRSGLSMLQNAG